MCESSKTGRHNSRIDDSGIDRWRRLRHALALGALSCALAACSTRTSERQILPWFKEGTSYFKFGGFAETPNDRTYLAQHLGFIWLPISASSAVALSDTVVLLDRGAMGSAVLTQGAWAPKPVCPMYGEVSVPPSTSTVECLQTISDKNSIGSAGYRELTVRRTRFDGETVYEKTIEVPDASHAFEKFSFYDSAGSAYFLAVSSAFLKDKRMPPDCMLLQGLEQDTRVAARRPDVTDVIQCYRTETWTEQIGPTVARWDTIKYPGSRRDPRK